jgi:hypothetical protein
VEAEIGTHDRLALVVAYDRAIGSAVAGWLEAAGFDVDLCPGPRGPAYRCIATDVRGCPLARIADVIVLDLWLQSDADDAGSSALELIRYYRSLGRSLIVLDHDRSASSFFVAQRVAILSWPPIRSEIERFAVTLAPEAEHSSDRPMDETFFRRVRPALV